MRTLRIGLCQINTTVGDIEGIRKRFSITSLRERRWVQTCWPSGNGCHRVSARRPLVHAKFIEANLKAIDRIARATSSITALVGFVDKDEDTFNSAALLHHGKRIKTYSKTFLPNYGVFDEDRYFQPGKENFVFTLKSTPIGPSICEDLWHPGDPIRTQAFTEEQN